eukprot:1832449-Pyramimonas_sp.AAC.1
MLRGGEMWGVRRGPGGDYSPAHAEDGLAAGGDVVIHDAVGAAAVVQKGAVREARRARRSQQRVLQAEVVGSPDLQDGRQCTTAIAQYSA